MSTKSETIVSNVFNKEFSSSAIQVILGSIFLAVSAQISVPLPFTPIPMSLQTLGVALLAITLGKRNAALAVMTYLIQATAGLPVLAGGLSNPFWMFTPRAGYLIGFLVSAYATGYLFEKVKSRSIFVNWLALSFNELIILTIGSFCLSYFVGIENALAMGVIPFIPGTLVKVTVATSSIKPIQWIKSKLS